MRKGRYCGVSSVRSIAAKMIVVIPSGMVKARTISASNLEVTISRADIAAGRALLIMIGLFWLGIFAVFVEVDFLSFCRKEWPNLS